MLLQQCCKQCHQSFFLALVLVMATLGSVGMVKCVVLKVARDLDCAKTGRAKQGCGADRGVLLCAWLGCSFTSPHHQRMKKLRSNRSPGRQPSSIRPSFCPHHGTVHRKNRLASEACATLAEKDGCALSKSSSSVSRGPSRCERRKRRTAPASR